MRGSARVRGSSADAAMSPRNKGKAQKEALGLRAKEIKTTKKKKSEKNTSKGAKESSSNRAQSSGGGRKPSTPKTNEILNRVKPAPSKKATKQSRNAGKISKSKVTAVSVEPLLPEEREEETIRTIRAMNRATERVQPTNYHPPMMPSFDSTNQPSADKYQACSMSTSGDSVNKLGSNTDDVAPVSNRDDVAPVTEAASQEEPQIIQPPAVRNQNAALRADVSEMTSQSFEGSEYSASQSKQPRREIPTMSTIDSERFLSRDEGVWTDDEPVYLKQRIAYMCIVVSALQLAILLIQLCLCGLASVDVNPMIGPFPDAFSEWGGKNAYLMLEEGQYFRFITPVFLHVGILHLLANAFCQLETCAFFEREWGSGRWLSLYVISGVGCVATSSAANPDMIGVCSSGALMGLFGAKIAQVITWSVFELRNNAYYDMVQLDQLGGVMCSLALLSMLSFFTYIDWSGHVGGLAAGFFAGMCMFCDPIESKCSRILWGGVGLSGLLGGGYVLGYLLIYETFPDEELADACSYYRNLYPEGYDCECVWN